MALVRRVLAYVEVDVNLAGEGEAAAWAFDLDLWGYCGPGPDEDSALRRLAVAIGQPVRLVVVERITGDEQAFERDHWTATADERARTEAIVAAARRETIDLIVNCPFDVLDFDDPERSLPIWARWRTLRQMAWHLADTESRYYLPSLGLPARPAKPELVAELVASGRHVLDVIATMPADLVRTAGGETWTATKLLRRLAWHERSELVTMRQLAQRARTHRGQH